MGSKSKRMGGKVKKSKKKSEVTSVGIPTWLVEEAREVFGKRASVAPDRVKIRGIVEQCLQEWIVDNKKKLGVL